MIVGNEQILHGAFTPAELILKIREVKRRVAQAGVDRRAVARLAALSGAGRQRRLHHRPPAAVLGRRCRSTTALDYAFDRLRQIAEALPEQEDRHRRDRLAEPGRPAVGVRRAPAHQAQFIREFLVTGAGANLDYFLMEAIDQPWKIDNEGRAGPYWGFLDAERQPKFSLQGPIETRRELAHQGGAVLGARRRSRSFWFMVAFGRMRLASRIAFGIAPAGGARRCSSGCWRIPFDYYLRPIDWIFVALLVPSLLAMSAILLANGFEFAEMFWPAT